MKSNGDFSLGLRPFKYVSFARHHLISIIMTAYVMFVSCIISLANIHSIEVTAKKSYTQSICIFYGVLCRCILPKKTCLQNV